MLSVPRNLLKTNASALVQLLRIADPVIIVVIGWVAQWIYLGTDTTPPTYWVAMLAVVLISLAVFPATGLYRPQRGGSLIEDLRLLASGWLTLLAIAVFLVFVTKSGDLFSRVWVAIWFACGFVLQAAVRLGFRLVLRFLRRRGYNLRHICIVGAGELGREVVLRLRRAPWTGLQLRGFYDDAPELAGGNVDGVPVLGTIDRLSADLERNDLDQVWIALPLRAEERIRRLVRDLRAQGYTLEGGRLDYLYKRSVAALVYRHGDHLINVFVWPASRGDAFPEQMLQDDGFHMRFWTRSSTHYCAISDLAQRDFVAFVHSYGS